MSNFVVYLHERPDTNAVFYVGKGTNVRVRQTSNRNPRWQRIVKKAGGFRSHLFAVGLNEDEALQMECLLIAEMRGAGVDLCNMTNGGDGITGYRFSDAAKAAMSANRKGRPAPNKGQKLSAEHIEKLRAAKVGRRQSAEHIKKCAQARIGKPLSEDRKKKIAAALTGRKTDPIVLAKKFKPVVCNTTGEIYESVTAAANALGLETSNISRCCQGRFRQTGGYSFEYITA